MKLLWVQMGEEKVKGYSYTGLNKIITNNLPKYSRLFSKEELNQILLAIAKIDITIKTTSIDDIILNDMLIFLICGINND